MYLFYILNLKETLNDLRYLKHLLAILNPSKVMYHIGDYYFKLIY